MIETKPLTNPSLEAKSPFELRVNLGRDVPESDVRTALASGDMGFLHSFTTGSTVDGPGVRVVAWTTGCHWRCRYCHNPDTWTLSNGVPVTLAKATEELLKYRYGLKVMSGGFTLSGGEPLMQDRFAVKLFTAAQLMGIHTAVEPTAALAAASPMRSWRRSTWCFWVSRPGTRNATAGLLEWRSVQLWSLRAAWLPLESQYGYASCWCPA